MKMMRDCKIGSSTDIVEPVNMYECVVGDNSFIGPFCEIQRGAFVGNNTRIQSHSFVCENVTIMDNCFIAHGVMFTNDKFKDGNLSKDFLPTNIGNNVNIGSNSTILPVTICDNVTIGAGSVVTKDITEPGIYAGNPARRIK